MAATTSTTVPIGLENPQEGPSHKAPKPTEHPTTATAPQFTNKNISALNDLQAKFTLEVTMPANPTPKPI